MTNKQNADASESFRQLMAAYSKAFSSTPDSVKEEENADDTATTTENGTTPSPRTASILDADDETTETALEFNLERAKLLNRQRIPGRHHLLDGNKPRRSRRHPMGHRTQPLPLPRQTP